MQGGKRRLLLIAVLLLLSSVTKADTCCADCLDQTDPATTVITYDPLVFDQCSAAKGICCYGCSFSYGSLSYQEGVTIDDNGTELASAGTRFSFTLNNVARVTYEILRVNQAQTNFVSNGTTEADRSDDGKLFSICADNPGTVIFRGWGDDECSQVTTQFSITVGKKTSSGSTCDSSADTATGSTILAGSASSTPNKPVDSTAHGTTTSSNGGQNDFASCNPTRGTVVTKADGSKTCQCTGDWRNPPSCDDFSYLKTVVTILGALATVISILLSVRAYFNSRKEKKARQAMRRSIEEHLDDGADDDDELEVQVIRIGSDVPLAGKLPPGTPGTRRPSFTGGEAWIANQKQTTL